MYVIKSKINRGNGYEECFYDHRGLCHLIIMTNNFNSIVGMHHVYYEF